MSTPNPSLPDYSPSLASLSLAAWETNADYWDASITKHGNKYWRRLQEPSLARLLGPSLSKPGGCKKALDLATGNGLCARWLRSKGAEEVVATDGCAAMLDIAKEHTVGDGEGGIRFRTVDVTSEGDLARLEEESKFDIVLMNMAAMDVPDLGPLARALPGLLAEGGVFVTTLLHPVFFTSGAARNIDVRFDPITGDCEVTRTKVIKEYMHVAPAMGIAVMGQPVKQPYFHRPMHELFTTFFKVGLVMDAMEELAFTEEDLEPRIESSSNYTQLPAVLAFRMRLP
ncbi:hypothetical protein VTI74DRAFT_5129 [Chaetomium olivicolor]